MAKAVEIRCPECNRWLADVIEYGRAICRDCGCEVTYQSRGQRVIDKTNSQPIRFPRHQSREPLAAHS